MKETDTFTYEYSGEEQNEIQRIANKYKAKNDREAKLEQLRKLDASVEKKGTIRSMIVGVIGSLVLGLGMACCMVWQGILFVPGIIIGVIGIAGAAMAYPVYIRTCKAEKERLAPEILELAKELM